MPLTAEQKTQAVTHLVTNCACWKGKEKVLNELPEEALVGIYNDQVHLAAAQDVFAAVKDLTGNAELTVNAMPAALAAAKKMKKKSNEGCNDNDGDEMTGNTVVVQPKTADEWMAAAPVEIREAVTNALSITSEEKTKLVARLVAGVKDDALKARLTANHLKKPLPQLRDEVAALPAPTTNGRPSHLLGGSGILDQLAHATPRPEPIYVGASGGPASQPAPKKVEPLGITANVDWSKKDTK
jgi:hypothetical protein